jgi:hypothetical protein
MQFFACGMTFLMRRSSNMTRNVYPSRSSAGFKRRGAMTA